MRKAPGVQFDVELNFAEDGLEPTIVILDDQGDDVYGPTTSGIIELEVDSQPSGAYLATIPAGTLTVADDGYTILASKLGTFDPETDDIITIPLEITSSVGELVAPSGRDLCSLADVLALLPGYREDATVEAKLQQFITSESQLVHEESGREIIGMGDQPQERAFEIDNRAARTGRIEIGDLATTDGLEAEVRTQEGVVTTTVDVDTVVGFYQTLRNPRNEWEPITRLGIPTGLAEGSVLYVTGEWGFPNIPAFAREATAKRVVLRYVSDVGGSDIVDAIDNLNLAAMFASARDAIHALDNRVLIS